MILTAYIALPLLLTPCFFIRKKGLSCLLCGVLIFAFMMLAGCENQANTGLYATYRMLPAYPVSLLPRFPLPIGFVFPAKLLSMLFPDTFALTAVLAALFTLGVMSYIYRYCETPAFSSLLAAAGGFLMFSAVDPLVFMVMLICAPAFRQVSQKRFLRFAAPVLLASCFCPDALLLLPLYFIFLIPAGIPLMLGGTAVCGALLLTGAYAVPFDLIYGKADDAALAGISPMIPAALAVLCAAAGVMKKLLICGRLSREYLDTMIVSLFTAAFLSLISVYDTRLLPLVLMLAFPSVLTLGGTLLNTSESLVVLTFREKKKPVLTGLAVLGLLLLAVWYWQLLSQSGAAFGIFGEVGAL